VPVPSQPAEPRSVATRPVQSNLPEPQQVKPKRVDPRPGETYLQLAAMGPRSTEDYLKELAVKGIYPSLGPGPSENLYRLLIGPYAKAAEREKAQRTLEGQGIQVMVRTY
jgi:cell division septation protein DedD